MDVLELEVDITLLSSLSLFFSGNLFSSKADTETLGSNISSLISKKKSKDFRSIYWKNVSSSWGTFSSILNINKIFLNQINTKIKMDN